MMTGFIQIALMIFQKLKFPDMDWIIDTCYIFTGKLLPLYQIIIISRHKHFNQ